MRIVVCLGLLAGIFFSFELWFPVNRSFPRAPLFFEAPIFIERLLSVILIVSLILTIFFTRLKILSGIAIGSLIVLVFFDQTRLQPWVYQYLLLLAVIALTKSEPDSNRIIGLAQLIIAGLYFWSGVQKLNYTFSHETLPILLAPLQNLFPSINLPSVSLGIALAAFETLVGIGLLFRRTRNLAVYLAAAMHLTILGLLIAKDYNSIVWIWNAALILLVFIAFWRSDVPFRETLQTNRDRKILAAKAIVAAAVLLPFFSFTGWWDMYLSGALYSGNVEVAVIRVGDELFEKLPPKAQRSVFRTKTAGEKMLPLFEWGINELNVPAYPERRVSMQIAREVCHLTDEKDQAELIVKERPAIWDGSYKITRIGCAELARY